MSETDELFYLPEELLITNILTRLPIKSLLRFKSVNKRMHSIISSPYFAKIHLEKSKSSNKSEHLLINHKTCFLSFDFESYGDVDNWDCSPFNDEEDVPENKAGLARIIDSNFHLPHSNVFVVGSCDGLVCLKTNVCIFYVWNPSTLECRTIPFTRELRKQDVVWGFNRVANENENDYRVVRICQNRLNNEKFIQVLSLIEYRWSFSHEEFQVGGEPARLAGLGVTVNNVITYWLYKAYDTENRENRWWVIGFDWGVAKLKSVPFPGWLANGLQRPPLMYVMDGCLRACWKMNDTQVVEVGMFATGSWTKLFLIAENNVVHSMCYRHQGMPNITNKNRFAIKNRDTLLLIHPEDDDIRTLTIPSSRNVVQYIESLISPFVTQKNETFMYF